MQDKHRIYYVLSYAFIALMGITLGGSITCFVVYLTYASSNTVGPRLIFLNIISYVLLLLFITLLISFTLVMWKIRVLKLEEHVKDIGSEKYEEKK